MRNGNRKDMEGWEGTVRHAAHGLCDACYKRTGCGARQKRRRARKTPQGVTEAGSTRHIRTSTRTQPTGPGRPLVYTWQPLPGDVPMVHQEHEAIRSLMGYLRATGLLLCSRPQVEVRHGQDALLRLHVRVRPATGSAKRKTEP
nr:hypothetical protein [Actinomyces sp.]